jgi:hypothetical protein
MRLCDALETIAEQSPQLVFVASAMRKQMARSPIGDEEIISSLVWVSEMINAIITGPGGNPMPEMPEGLTDTDLRILDLMGKGEDLITGTDETATPYYQETPLPEITPEDNP